MAKHQKTNHLKISLKTIAFDVSTKLRFDFFWTSMCCLLFKLCKETSANCLICCFVYPFSICFPIKTDKLHHTLQIFSSSTYHCANKHDATNRTYPNEMPQYVASR